MGGLTIVRLSFFCVLSLAYMKKKLYLCSANPQWGSANGGAVVRSAANKSIFANKFEHYKNNV